MITNFGTYGSLTIRAWSGCDTEETKQVAFPRSKKRRIRKKWAKNSANWETTPVSHMYVLGSQVLLSPNVVARLRLEIPEVKQ